MEHSAALSGNFAGEIFAAGLQASVSQDLNQGVMRGKDRKARLNTCRRIVEQKERSQCNKSSSRATALALSVVLFSSPSIET